MQAYNVDLKTTLQWIRENAGAVTNRKYSNACLIMALKSCGYVMADKVCKDLKIDPEGFDIK